MNPSTDKTQTTPSLTDQSEAIGTILEQAGCVLDLLLNEYQSSPHLPVFMTIDDLLGKARQQLNDLLVNLPTSSNKAQLFARKVYEEATKLEALNKSLLTWIETQNLNSTAAQLEMNAGDAYMLTVTAITTAQTIGDYADSYTFRGTWGAQA